MKQADNRFYRTKETDMTDLDRVELAARRVASRIDAAGNRDGYVADVLRDFANEIVKLKSSND